METIVTQPSFKDQPNFEIKLGKLYVDVLY